MRGHGVRPALCAGAISLLCAGCQGSAERASLPQSELPATAQAPSLPAEEATTLAQRGVLQAKVAPEALAHAEGLASIVDLLPVLDDPASPPVDADPPSDPPVEPIDPALLPEPPAALARPLALATAQLRFAMTDSQSGMNTVEIQPLGLQFGAAALIHRDAEDAPLRRELPQRVPGETGAQRVHYRKLFGTGAHLEFTLRREGLEQALVLEAPPARVARAATYELVDLIEVPAGTELLDVDRAIGPQARLTRGPLVLRNAAGHALLNFPPPHVADAATVPGTLRENEAVASYRVRRADARHYEVATVVNRRWLDSDARQFPVRIDPPALPGAPATFPPRVAQLHVAPVVPGSRTVVLRVITTDFINKTPLTYQLEWGDGSIEMGNTIGAFERFHLYADSDPRDIVFRICDDEPTPRCHSKTVQFTPGAGLSTVIDADGDGIGNDRDNCPENWNPDQGDRDEDGLPDGCDNCPDDKNVDQADVDDDGAGDACDDDSDNDGVPDDDDLDPFDPDVCADADTDGADLCGGDCDDSDNKVLPGAEEICDSLDNNCDGEIDEGDVCVQGCDDDADCNAQGLPLCVAHPVTGDGICAGYCNTSGDCAADEGCYDFAPVGSLRYCAPRVNANSNFGDACTTGAECPTGYCDQALGLCLDVCSTSSPRVPNHGQCPAGFGCMARDVLHEASGLNEQHLYCVPDAIRNLAAPEGGACLNNAGCQTGFCNTVGGNIIPGICRHVCGSNLDCNVGIQHCEFADGHVPSLTFGATSGIQGCIGNADEAAVLGFHQLSDGDFCTDARQCVGALCLTNFGGPGSPGCSSNCSDDADCGPGLRCRGALLNFTLFREFPLLTFNTGEVLWTRLCVDENR